MCNCHKIQSKTPLARVDWPFIWGQDPSDTRSVVPLFSLYFIHTFPTACIKKPHHFSFPIISIEHSANTETCMSTYQTFQKNPLFFTQPLDAFVEAWGLSYFIFKKIGMQFCEDLQKGAMWSNDLRVQLHEDLFKASRTTAYISKRKKIPINARRKSKLRISLEECSSQSYKIHFESQARISSIFGSSASLCSTCCKDDVKTSKEPFLKHRQMNGLSISQPLHAADESPTDTDCKRLFRNEGLQMHAKASLISGLKSKEYLERQIPTTMNQWLFQSGWKRTTIVTKFRTRLYWTGLRGVWCEYRSMPLSGGLHISANILTIVLRIEEGLKKWLQALDKSLEILVDLEFKAG